IRDLSFLSPGLKIELVDERGDEQARKSFYSEKGLPDFLEYIRRGREKVSKPIFINKEVDGIKIELAMQYVADYSEEFISFVNKIKTSEGGVHVVGFHTALTRAITSYMQKNLKKDKIEIVGDDTREGLIGILSIMMRDPEFEGQTKEKLGNSAVKSIVDSALYSAFSTYFEENPADINSIIEKVKNAANARESAKRARELARKKSVFDGPILSGKLADCTEDDPEKSEIFIVEGESAAGSSKQGRDRFYQAILPLRGKVLNVEKATSEKIFANKEFHIMVAAFGTGMLESFDLNKLRYNKIIFLTDADVDGSHISTLLLTFFYRYLRPLIEHGKIYIAQPPLYRISKGKEVAYAYNDAQLAEKLRIMGNDASIQRYKGLGEMNPAQLWETTMDPQRRILKKVNIKDVELADSIFSILMGLNTEERKKFLIEHAKEVNFLDV
ncbi:MAG: toprim domain-containing protein, partial [Candidatus Micrarchaeaceae archaeon]